MYKVSILIPIYNVEKYLRQCLESVVNQTLKDIEIICINDGSTDNSLSIIKEFADRDSRVKIIDKKNTGYGHSMNCGLKIAEGEYIGIIESDDFADLNMFEVLYNKAKSVDAEIVRSNHWEIADNYSKFMEILKEEPYEKVFSPKIENYDLFSRQIAIWSAIYKHDLLLKNDILFTETPGASYQDVSFYFKALSCSDRVLLIKDAFVNYRVDNPNASMRSKAKVYAIFNEFDAIEKFLSQRPELKKPFRYIFESMIKFKRCEFHFSRIDNNFKFEFFQRMHEEFKKDNAAGYLDKVYWNEDSWQNVQELLNDKEKFFYRKFDEMQIINAYRSDFFLRIKDFRNIYLYGAGQAAISILFKLLQWKLNIKGIAVSNMSNNPESIFNVPVAPLDESNIDKIQDVILISITESNQYKILYDLQSKGYKNIILMTNNLRKALI